MRKPKLNLETPVERGYVLPQNTQPEPDFSLQISQLQQRHQAILEQTALELDQLKDQLASRTALRQYTSQETINLQTEVQRLNQYIAQLEQQRDTERVQYEKQYQDLRNIITTLRAILETQSSQLGEQVSYFSQNLTGHLDTLVKVLEPNFQPVLPPLSAPEPVYVPKVAPVEPILFQNPTHSEEAPNLFVDPTKKTKKSILRIPRLLPSRRIMVRSFAFASIVALAVVGWKHLPFAKNGTAEAGVVAGVSSGDVVTPEQAPTAQYAESFADVPFEATVWDQTNNPDFGLIIHYPKNTTNMVGTVGGNNLFFLRKEGYLFKITKYDTDIKESLDSWMETNAKKDFASDYTFAKSTFKGQPAILATPNVRNLNSGYIYYLKRSAKVYAMWVKDEPDNTDDGQRIKKMIESLQFTN